AQASEAFDFDAAFRNSEAMARTNGFRSRTCATAERKHRLPSSVKRHKYCGFSSLSQKRDSGRLGPLKRILLRFRLVQAAEARACLRLRHRRTPAPPASIVPISQTAAGSGVVAGGGPQSVQSTFSTSEIWKPFV